MTDICYKVSVPELEILLEDDTLGVVLVSPSIHVVVTEPKQDVFVKFLALCGADIEEEGTGDGYNLSGYAWAPLQPSTKLTELLTERATEPKLEGYVDLDAGAYLSLQGVRLLNSEWLEDSETPVMFSFEDFTVSG